MRNPTPDIKTTTPIGVKNSTMCLWHNAGAPKDMQKALGEREKMLSDAQRLSHVGSWMWIIKSDTVIWSDELYAITGLDNRLPAPAYARLPAFYTKESWQALKKAVDDAVHLGLPYELELDMVRTDGRIRATVTCGQAIKDRSGSVFRLLGTVQDITERKEVEKALAVSEEKYRAIFEQAADSIVLLDAETGMFADYNDKACKNLGYSRSEFKNLNISDFEVMESASDVKKHIDRIIKNGHDIFETKHRRKDGKLLDMLVNAKVFSVSGKKYIQAIWHDITAQKQAERQTRLTLEKLRRITEGTIQAMSKALEVRDPYTAGHQRRVSRLACVIAKRMNLMENQVEGVRVAGVLHDIGKIYVPAEILANPRKLNEMEMKIIREHPRVGYEILKNEEFPWPIADIVLQHHERMDGSGYPSGISGNDIMLEAKILGIADIIEAMASHRPYRPALGIDRAVEEISQNRGKLYDAKIADICIKLFACRSKFHLNGN